MRIEMPTVENREWGVLLKAGVRSGELPPDRSQLDRLLGALPGPDKRLTSGGADFTVAWWVDAPDAASATRIAAETVRQIARSEGLPRLTFIRAHAASVEGRSPVFLGPELHLDSPGEWAVDFRAYAPTGSKPVAAEVLERIRTAMDRPNVAVTFRGDQEKFLVDDGSGFTVRVWAAGGSPGEAFRTARRDVLAALAEVGLSKWMIVRFKASTAQFKHEDAFPGAGARVPSETEEVR